MVSSGLMRTGRGPTSSDHYCESQDSAELGRNAARIKRDVAAAIKALNNGYEALRRRKVPRAAASRHSVKLSTSCPFPPFTRQFAYDTAEAFGSEPSACGRRVFTYVADQTDDIFRHQASDRAGGVDVDHDLAGRAENEAGGLQEAAGRVDNRSGRLRYRSGIAAVPERNVNPWLATNSAVVTSSSTHSAATRAPTLARASVAR